MEPSESLPVATVVRKPNKVSGVVFAALFVVALGVIVGVVLAYVAAFLVVKVGLPAPKLVVGLPLVAVGGLAWAATSRQSFRDGVITVIVAGALAAALIAAWGPSSPATLFKTESKVTDVHVEGDHANIALESTTRMSEMPPFGATLGYATLLACFAVIVGTLGAGIVTLRARRTPTL